jgi:hypothetical protein
MKRRIEDVETGFDITVLSTFPNPTIVLSIPETVL